MAPDRFVDRRRAAVVKQGPAQSQPPERRGANLLRKGLALPDAVARADVVQQQVREQRNRPPVERRMGARARGQRRNVAGGTAYRGIYLLADTDGIVDSGSIHRRQEAHEGLEVVDAALAGGAIAQIFGIGHRIAPPHLGLRDAERRLVRKQIVGDPHFVAIGVSAKTDQRRVLRFPAEPPDALLTGFDVRDQGGPAADSVAVEILRILEIDQRLIRNRFDQPGSEEGNWHPPGKYVRVGRQNRLTAVTRNREHVEEGVARLVERFELAVGVPASCPQLGHRPGAADRGNVVADGAARAVERRTKAFF